MTTYINGRYEWKNRKKTGDMVVGNFGEDMVNDKGERLIELCTQTSLKIWNGFFNHKNIHESSTQRI